MSNFEKAAKIKLRFDLNGATSTEDLYDFSKEKLADYEVILQERIDKQGKSNRFAKKAKSIEIDSLRLAIVSHIIDLKVSEEEESANAIIKKQERDELLSLLAQKQKAKMSELTEEEIQARLEALKV